MEFLGQFERWLAELYPYRYPLSAVVLAIAGIALFTAYRLNVHRALWRRKYWTTGIGLPVLVLTVFVGNYLLSPLWTRTTVVEESPLAQSGQGGSMNMEADTSTPLPTARLVQAGEWKGADAFHFAEGRALIIETEPGVYVLRVEDFSVRNGPDLFVLLSTDPDGYSSNNVNLGGLRAAEGAFNYDIPAGTDLTQFKSVVIWCDAFRVLFGTATLMQPN